MAGKVIHVSESIHKMARQYCDMRGLWVSTWVEHLINQAVEGNKPSDMAVRKRGKEKFNSDKDDDVWSKPPFWSGK